MKQPGRGDVRQQQPRTISQPRRRPRGERLAPPRDTGIVLGARRGRTPPNPRNRDDWVLPLVGMLALLIAAGLAAYWGTLEPPPPPRRASADVPEPPAISVPKITAAPTPAFATYGALRLRLPVAPESVTTVAFHQATFNHALPMASLAPDMSLGNARLIASQLRALASGAATSAPAAAAATAAAAASSVPADTWRGSVIRLYRSGRSGKPDTAVDVGAPPGTPVLAPVDGTVVLVRTYKLYSKYDDYEIHISPTAQPDVDVVLIHITDVCVQPGQRLAGGISRIASVRQLSSLTALQLKDYAPDGGDHTHLQVNRLPQPGMIWISTPAGPKATPFVTSSSAATVTGGPAPGNE